jgi:hypothetical protein
VKSNTWSCSTRLPPCFSSPQEARVFVRHNLVGHHLSYLLDPVVLCASELATNVILHARTDYTVTLVALGDILALQVEDYTQDNAPGLTGMAADRQVRAMASATSCRGLELVALLSHEWGVTTDRPGFKTVWASFRTPGM